MGMNAGSECMGQWCCRRHGLGSEWVNLSWGESREREGKHGPKWGRKKGAGI